MHRVLGALGLSLSSSIFANAVDGLFTHRRLKSYCNQIILFTISWKILYPTLNQILRDARTGYTYVNIQMMLKPFHHLSGCVWMR